MNSIKMRGVFAAVTGALLFGAAAPAMADSNDDIIYALMAKGVLTEEEGHQLLDGRDKERATQQKQMKSAGKVKISDAIDNATIYGDVRVRHEYREGTGTVSGTNSVKETANKDRYKITLGVKTEAGDWYSDLAMAMGAKGRSDNADLGSSSSISSNGVAAKDGLYVKRAMFGWKATDWLTLEAGRMDNPLYTTSMVWDPDLVVQGFTEKVKFKAGEANVFLTATQSTYVGPKVTFSPTASGSTVQSGLFAFQGGAQYAFNDKTSAKAAVTYTTYSRDHAWGVYVPGKSTSAYSNGFPAVGSGTASTWGTNDLNTIEIPAELNYMATGNVGVRLFGDYVYNTSGSDRYNAAIAAAGANANAIRAAGNDDNAWLLGFSVGSAKDLKAFESNKMAQGDWNAKIWYQEVGAYSIDQNLTDTDVFDARVNTKGTVFKSQYNLKDNVALNFTAAHATRKNGELATSTSAGNDLGLNLSKFNLLQLDLTYKF